MEDRIGRELRRHQLALRMIAHRARRRTICNFTGLARERIKTLRREWNVRSKGRRRGPSPTSLSAFFPSTRMRSEVSVIAVFCKVYGAVPNEKMAKADRYFPNLDRGERLCEVYEAYRTYFPASQVNFEQIVLLAIGLAERDSLELRNCVTCPRIVVIDPLSIKHRNCSRCERLEERRLFGSPEIADAATLSGKKTHEAVVGHQKQRATHRESEHPQKGKCGTPRNLKRNAVRTPRSATAESVN